MSIIRVKQGVLFTTIAPAGFYILHAIQQTANNLNIELTITSACDGVHSGLNDPHHTGEAYDVRSNDMTPEQKDNILTQVMTILGWEKFYGFLESPGTDNEHFHFQRKKGTIFS